jgi:hypothetical protein
VLPVVRVRPTYLLASLALLVAFPCVVGVLSPGPSAGATWATLIASGTVAAIFLSVEARRDLYPFAQFMLVTLLFPLTFAIAAYLVAESEVGRARAVGGGVACVLGIAAAVGVLWHEHHAKDVVPDVLFERFGADSVFEIDGVQWVVERGPAEVAQGAWVEIFLQNCVAAERSVTVTLEDVTGLFKRRGSLAMPPPDPVSLGPGEVGALWVPVRAGPRPAREALLYVSVRARGARGQRVRKRRARAASERVKLGFQLFALLGGHLMWGGGVHCSFENAGMVAGDSPGRARWRPLSVS